MRISIKDQSLYSLEYQDRGIRDYCTRNNLNLISVFKDEGEHSDTFDRPNWLALEQFIKKYKGKVKYLIIIDYDRFSRDLAEALLKIKELENRLGVKILSTHEHIDTDTQDPQTFMNRAFKLMVANHELINIRRRTKNGIRTALEAGRMVNLAPFGYKNARDEQGKAIIVIDPVKSKIVEKIFTDFLYGVSIASILKSVTRQGFNLKSQSAVSRILLNPVYAGLLKVPAGNNEPEKMVRAIHTPIISEAVYWQVNEQIIGRTRGRAVPRPEVPLRGILRCTCGAALTAGFSKGRNKYYLYYRCVHEPWKNYRGEKLHEMVDELLHNLSFSARQLQIIISKVKDKFDEQLKNRAAVIKNKDKALTEVNKKINDLEEKLINGVIENSTYKKWFSKLSGERSLLQSDITKLKGDINQRWSKLEKALPHLCDMKNLYHKLGINAKQKLLKMWFKPTLIYDGEVLRTNLIHPSLMANYLSIKEKRLLFVEQPSLSFAKNSISTPDGS
ncbi:recombinase family protein [Chitinophaga polysaccharea]|uniref:recombinase family protein n=1 Tax=Chitinophaga polysaccharea TaxID=1293035 RepID=UPI0021B03ED5|nr:recombinase family protein [Chitinophaga polysaccharea]